MKSFILLLLSCAIAFFSSAITTKEKTVVHFETAKYQLLAEAKKELDQIVEKAKASADFEIFIEGHTDSRGSIAYNDKLSSQRTEAVKAYLLEKGIAEKYVKIDFQGELDPLRPNTNSNNLQENRRVEVLLSTYHFESTEELEEALNPQRIQEIIIDPQERNVIQGKAGVKAFIPENSFVTASGEKVEGEVVVELEEALSMHDFIASGLTTKSSDQILESGGMLRLSAKDSKGQELQLQEGAQLALAVPSTNRQDDMEVFVSGSGVDWQPTEEIIDNQSGFEMDRAFPKLETKTIPKPEFEFPDAPKAPKKIIKPKKPHKPNIHSYLKPIPWYVINRRKRTAEQEKRYFNAMDRYDKRMERFERLMVRYDKKNAIYKEEYLEYEVLLEQHKVAKKEAFEQFKRTPAYVEAMKKQEAINDILFAKYQEQVKQWREERKALFVKWSEGMDMMGMTSEESLNNYIFTVNQMDWINVDRFYKMEKEELMTLVLHTDDVENAKAMVLFKNMRSVLPCLPAKDDLEPKFALNNFPKKEEAFIFAYKVEDGKPYLCYMAVNRKKNHQLKYMESSLVEIKMILKEFEDQV